MKRHTTFRFTLVPTREQREALRRHTGASRFAFNQCLRLVTDALEAKKEAPETRVPWSGFDLINAFNRWKRSAAAGVDEAGREGLAWRGEVLQQVFEEAAVNLGRALEAFTASRKGERKGQPARFPKFKKKSDPQQSFRIRNKKDDIRVGEASARSVRLPKLGTLAVRECTRKLRRMLRKGRAEILFATVAEREGRWTVSLNVEAAPLHEAHRHDEADARPAVGIDRGLTTFAVVADATGRELERIESPRPLRAALPKLRRKSRALSRKQKGSRNRQRARQRLSRLHRRIGNVRRDFVHRQSSRLAQTPSRDAQGLARPVSLDSGEAFASTAAERTRVREQRSAAETKPESRIAGRRTMLWISRLAQTHRLLVLEDLCTKGLMRTRLARSIADSAWAMFASMLAYKAAWYGGMLTLADRFYPSTRRCSACGQSGPPLGLSERTFHCSCCGHEADRDTNAAVCLGQFPGLEWPPVAAKQAETLNGCGETSAGAQATPGRETRLDEAERASARRPGRAVWTVREIVHML